MIDVVTTTDRPFWRRKKKKKKRRRRQCRARCCCCRPSSPRVTNRRRQLDQSLLVLHQATLFSVIFSLCQQGNNEPQSAGRKRIGDGGHQRAQIADILSTCSCVVCASSAGRDRVLRLLLPARPVTNRLNGLQKPSHTKNQLQIRFLSLSVASLILQ